MTMRLRLIGYWTTGPGDTRGLPDPHDFVDPDWDEDARYAVEAYLSQGTYLRGFMGLSPCRICGTSNGSGEVTDGVLACRRDLSTTCGITTSGCRRPSRHTSSDGWTSWMAQRSMTPGGRPAHPIRCQWGTCPWTPSDGSPGGVTPSCCTTRVVVSRGSSSRGTPSRATSMERSLRSYSGGTRG